MLLINFIESNKSTLLNLSIAILAFLAFLKISDEFYRLVLSDSRNAAIDLKIVKRGINLWFSNRPIVAELHSSVYPPPSYAMLWPFIGWIDFSTARVVIAISFIPSLILTAYLFLKNSLAKNKEELFLAVSIPLSMNAVGVTIGNGQLSLHALLLFVFAILLLKQKEVSFAKEILISIMILISLIKPSITAPFLWILLIVYPNRRIIILTIFSYALLTFAAFYFRGTDLQGITPVVFATLLFLWILFIVYPNRRIIILTIFSYALLTFAAFYYREPNLQEVTSVVSDILNNIRWATIVGNSKGGYANLHSLLAYLGLEELNLIAPCIFFIIFGLWVYLNKKADIWLLLAVTAIFSRLWMYHRVYDNILLIVPMITLFRFIKLEHLNIGIKQISLILFIITTVSMIAPASLQLLAPWSYFFEWGHTIVFFVLLFWFLYLIRRTSQITNTT